MILNNQEWLLAIFKKKGLTPTGKLEFATIDGIDSALAQALNEAFDSQVVSFNDRTNQSFREFLKRTLRDRITLGTFSDVKEWLSSFEADRAGRKDIPAICFNWAERNPSRNDRRMYLCRTWGAIWSPAYAHDQGFNGLRGQ